jgi:predicted MFS family arabinose efflux permease
VPDPARPPSAAAPALTGLAALASAMGVGRFAFTPLLPLMQQAGAITLAQGGSLARANYLGYLAGAVLCTIVRFSPGRVARLGLVAVAALTAGMGLTDAFPAWVVLRFLAGVASAFVLVGVSAWVLPLLAARGRPAWSGWVYTGVGTGVLACGLVGLAAGVLDVRPRTAWLLLGAGSAAVAIVCWRALGAEAPAPALAAAPGAPPRAAAAWRAVVAYGAFGFGYIVPATFLPAAARAVVRDPAVFAWTWPVFGLAAAVSTIAASRWWRGLPPRTVWARAQLVMAVGVLAPAWRTTVSTLLVCAVCVGGTFMVVTMAGLQEARRLAGPGAARLMAAMTAAFAVGQLVGPFTVTSLDPSAGVAVPHVIAAAVLLLGLAVLVLGPAPASTPAGERIAAPGSAEPKSLQPGDRP